MEILKNLWYGIVSVCQIIGPTVLTGAGVIGYFCFFQFAPENVVNITVAVMLVFIGVTSLWLVGLALVSEGKRYRKEKNETEDSSEVS